MTCGAERGLQLESVLRRCVAAACCGARLEGPRPPAARGAARRGRGFAWSARREPGGAARARAARRRQGCNLALESCAALDAALAGTGCDLDAAPAAYSRARVADAHAFQDLEVMQVALAPTLCCAEHASLLGLPVKSPNTIPGPGGQAGGRCT